MEKLEMIKCAAKTLDTVTDIDLSKEKLNIEEFGKVCGVGYKDVEKIKEEIFKGNLDKAKKLVMSTSLKKIELG